MQNNINDIISKKIDNIVKNNNIFHAGKVTKINDFIIEATGLEDAFYFEKVYINNEDNIGYVERIEENKVVISLIKNNGDFSIGDFIITTGEILQTSFSENSIGMIIDAFGIDKMTERKINDSVTIPIESRKISIMERSSVCRPLETGIAAIDMMFPIGKGQRQLIIGDKKTGKTQICLDTIVNQKGKNVICIYVAIGKTKKELKNLYAKLVSKGAQAYTLIVAAFNDDTPPLIKLTPYVALSIATYLMENGKDVLVCIDDLKKHADACREISLLSEKNIGREAYPSDIFYTHSRLLEKGCQHQNGGSITILPIVETRGEDITDYISTNIISITDGQIVLSEKNFRKGQKPAINFGLSVSRLGGAVQKESIKAIGAKVRRELLSYLETADVYQLVNVDSMSEELKEKLKLGQTLLDLLKQPKFTPIDDKDIIERFGFILNNDKKSDNTLEKESDNDDSDDNTENNSEDDENNTNIDNNQDNENNTSIDNNQDNENNTNIDNNQDNDYNEEQSANETIEEETNIIVLKNDEDVSNAILRRKEKRKKYYDKYDKEEKKLNDIAINPVTVEVNENNTEDNNSVEINPLIPNYEESTNAMEINPVSVEVNENNTEDNNSVEINPLIPNYEESTNAMEINPVSVEEQDDNTVEFLDIKSNEQDINNNDIEIFDINGE